MKTKQTTYVRKLRSGDLIEDEGKLWAVTKNPIVREGKEVEIGLAPITLKRRYTRTFVYEIDARVKLG